MGWDPARRAAAAAGPDARGSEGGRSRGAEAGAGPGGGAPGRRREAGELLGAPCSVSRGASDLSPAGKASVGAPPPLPESRGAALGGLGGRRGAGEAEAARPWLSVFTWGARNNVLHLHDGWGERSCCRLRTVSFEN